MCSIASAGRVVYIILCIIDLLGARTTRRSKKQASKKSRLGSLMLASSDNNKVKLQRATYARYVTITKIIYSVHISKLTRSHDCLAYTLLLYNIQVHATRSCCLVVKELLLRSS